MSQLGRHLLFRTGFGPPFKVPAGVRYNALVDRVVDGASKTAAPLNALELAPMSGRPRDKSARKMRRMMRREAADGMRLDWLERMRGARHPLRERMTLFWHNHFATELRKVRSPMLMKQQNETFRKHAMAPFGELLGAMLRDPALLFYLDNQKNRKAAPNENLARELFELFTLGEGNYSEVDIKEAARALTGHSIKRNNGGRDVNYRFRRGLHDDGHKVIFKERGRFSGDDLVGLCLSQRACANFLVKKLWREFINDAPEKRAVASMAREYRASNYDTRALLKSMLKSRAFKREAGKGSIIKSPALLVIGVSRMVPLDLEGGFYLRAMRQMGQDLFNPPNVAGWRGAKRWIDAATLSAREAFIARALREAPPDIAEKLPLATARVDRSRALLQDPAFQVI